MNSSTPPATLTKAVTRAAAHLGLSQLLPDILGVDAQTVQRMSVGDAALDPNRPEWQAATRFASLFRSLLSLAGTADQAREWLDTSHQTLGAKPIDMLRSAAGREQVMKYLDAVQKFEIKLPPRGRQH